MSRHWPIARLGDVLKPVTRSEAVDAIKEYRLLGIRLDGQGPFLRETVTGAQTAATKLFRVAAEDFIYSRLFAWRGAFGIISQELDGCYVSGEFPTFLPVTDRLDVRFLRFWFRMPQILAFVEDKCSGSTPLTRNRFKEEFFLALEIPLPPIAEQQRMVARIEGLSAQLSDARTLREQAAEEAEALLQAQTRHLFEQCSKQMGTLGKGLVSCRNGISRRPSGTEEGPIVLRLADVSGGDISLHSPRRGALTDSEIDAYSLESGDLLAVRVNGSRSIVGKFIHFRGMPETVCYNDHLIRIRLDPAVFEPAYVARMSASPQARAHIEKVAITTAGQLTVNQGMLAAIPIPAPPVSEQRLIVAELDALQQEVDALKRHQTETAAELDALLPAILDRAFRGEL